VLASRSIQKHVFKHNSVPTQGDYNVYHQVMPAQTTMCCRKENLRSTPHEITSQHGN